MSDEIPPAPSESNNDLSKSETIRITLPPKNEGPSGKRETVRINVPNPEGPKRETAKIPNISPVSATPPPPPAPPKPFVPPPPGAVGNTPPPPALKPMSAPTPPPKPPGLAPKPTVPLKPSPVAAPAGSGITPAPKKETARITLPTDSSKQLPKATVKMQQTQPLVSRPAPSLTSSAIQQAPVTVVASSGAITGLSIAATVFAIGSLVTAILAYKESAARFFQF